MVHNNTLPIYHVALKQWEEKHFLNIYDLLELVKSGEMSEETYVWKNPMKNWVKAGRISELKPLFAMPPVFIPEDDDILCD